MTVPEFVDAVRRYCALTDASVTSWGRTPKHNAAVGGVAFSAHQAWLGLDVVYDTPIPDERCREWAARMNLKLIAESDHHHLQPADWRAG